MPLATTQSVPVAETHADEQRLEWRILVVDDNEDAANATATLVEEMGGEARVAYDGESALEMLQEYQPEAILLDIGMRGLDGYQTCQRIRRVLGNRVLLVALTGFGQEQDKDKATRAGFDAHLTKPTDGAALVRIMAYRTAAADTEEPVPPAARVPGTTGSSRSKPQAASPRETCRHLTTMRSGRTPRIAKVL